VIDMQVLEGVLLALAALVGLAIVLALVMLAAGSVSKPGQAPHGGIGPDLPEPQHPQSDTEDDRVLVLQ
jgi:hypothetical protein